MPWLSLRPSSVSPNQCPSGSHIVRRRLAIVAGTRQRRPMCERARPLWMWRIDSLRAMPPSDNRHIAHQRWRRSSGDPTRIDNRHQTDGYSREPAGAVPHSPLVVQDTNVNRGCVVWRARIHALGSWYSTHTIRTPVFRIGS